MQRSISWFTNLNLVGFIAVSLLALVNPAMLVWFNPASPANYCTLFQKECEVGETILISKWAVPVFLP